MMVLPDSCLYQYHVPLLIVGYHPDREPQKHYSRHLLPANLRSIAVTGGLRHPHGHALVPIVAPVRVDESLIILVKLFEACHVPCPPGETFGRAAAMFFWAQNSIWVPIPVTLRFKADSAGEVSL